jgi:hypothetical protein
VLIHLAHFSTTYNCFFANQLFYTDLQNKFVEENICEPLNSAALRNLQQKRAHFIFAGGHTAKKPSGS